VSDTAHANADSPEEGATLVFTYFVALAEFVSFDTTRVKARFSAFNLSFSALSFCNCWKE
jgi:hypothetical protein